MWIEDSEGAPSSGAVTPPLLRVVELTTTAATAGIPAAVGASLTVRTRRGAPVAVGASAPSVAWADVLQGETLEGPCVTVLQTGIPVRCDDVLTDERWPRWGRRLRAAGLGGCLATPVLGPTGCDGVLEAYAPTGREFDPRDEVLLAVLAELLGAAAAAHGVPLAATVGVD